MGQKGGYLLSSRRDPLKVGMGKVGITNDDSSLLSPSLSNGTKDSKSREKL